MLAEQPNITVMLDHHTRDVVKDGNRVTAVYVLDRPRMIRKTLLAQVFIDATYEGDLAAQAGAAYRIGREGKSEFNEEHAGEIFWDPPKTRVVFGSGRGDRKVQAYNYRLSVTNDPANRYRFPAPTAYDRKPYVTLIPDIQSGRVKNLEQVMSILPLPNRKFDANNHPLGNPSTDLIGGSDTYPEADVWQREPLAEAHRQHILGLLYFVQNDPEVPAAFRLQARHWGFAFDEFVDNERFPTQLYVREGRRIIGQDIFTENDARSLSPERRPNFHRNSIAVADYPIDSHATSLEKNGLLEGFFYLPGTQTQPSQIPYGVMMPLGLEGVIVSGCVSSTHIGYGTLRMEPVFMALGTTAGTAAHLSLREGVTPSQLDSSHLQRLLLQQKQVICVFNDVPIDHPHWQALQYFGTKGFLPQYTAHPDASITRAEAAQWLWQWMQLHRSDLRPMLVDTRHYTDLKADAASFIAVHSLTWWKVLAGATGADGIAHTATATMFNPDEPLVTSVVDKWLSAATRVLGRRTATDYHRTPSPEGIMTRGGFLLRLYETESLVKGPSTISRR
jgi:hypothetical protein